MTEKEIKGVANKIADALIEPLFKTHPDHQSCWQIADAVLKGMYGFILPNSSFTFYSDKVATAKLNLQALYELSKNGQLPMFYSNTLNLATELEKTLPDAIEESINQGFISFTEENNTDDVLPTNPIK